MNKTLLLCLPFALLGIALWLADGLDPHAHLRVKSVNIGRIQAEISGEASMLAMDMVCIQDTFQFHFDEIVGMHEDTKNAIFGFELARNPVASGEGGHVANFKLQLDFVKVGMEEEMARIFSELKSRGLDVTELREEDGEILATISGSLPHAAHPGEQVSIPEANLRMRWGVLGKTYVKA